ncbi:hypothetical protein ABT025_14120 [Streptomyces sp. NPDC002809]|uniref:hypothetical protein n=1 Tax=Streptomyces sp. NPDC002809 TaxID=3154433 RepID=UPI003324B664
MIAGITHLTMEADLDRGVDAATAWGLGLRFRDEVALPASFEQVEDDAHMLPLALLAGPGLQLEVVQHRRTSGGPGAYTGVFACRPPAGPPVRDRPRTGELLRRAGLVKDPVCVAVPVPRGEAWFDASAAADGLAGILCSVRDVPREAEFWSDFARAKWVRVTADEAWGRLPSPLPGSSGAIVLESRTAGAPTRAGAGHAMNDRGFPSMGVLSTAVDADCARAVDAGGALLAAPITTAVDGRSVRMALFETPGGAPVELLSVAAGPRRLRSADAPGALGGSDNE